MVALVDCVRAVAAGDGAQIGQRASLAGAIVGGNELRYAYH